MAYPAHAIWILRAHAACYVLNDKYDLSDSESRGPTKAVCPLLHLWNSPRLFHSKNMHAELQ